MQELHRMNDPPSMSAPRCGTPPVPRVNTTVDSSPVIMSEEIAGDGGGSSLSRHRWLHPFSLAKRNRTRRTMLMPVRSLIMRMMPLAERSESPTFLRSPSMIAPRSPIAISTIQHFLYPSDLEITQRAQHHVSMEDLPEPLVAEIVKRITQTSDLNSFSLLSKRLYTIEADQRGAIRVGRGLCPATEALASLCTRFPNLWKVAIDYSGWTPDHGNQLDNKGFLEFCARSPSLTDLTLNFCLHINDSGLGYLAYCKKLMSLRLNCVRKTTSSGILSVAVGCSSLSCIHLVGCNLISSTELIDYLGQYRSLEELVVKNCRGISQYDLLKFGPGWMKLRKFEFVNISSLESLWDQIRDSECYDSSYDAHTTNRYDYCCESMKDLRLASFATGPEIGLRDLLGKCKALEKLCLEDVHGLNDKDMIAISKRCNNLRSISLRLTPKFYDDYVYTTSFTDDSIMALALSCPMLHTVELTFADCEPTHPSEIGFTREGLVFLIKACPIRVLVLNGANFFDDNGMKAVSAAPFLETLVLMDCNEISDVGMRYIVHTPCLSNLTLRWCKCVTNGGFSDLVHAQKLESLTIEGCPRISEKALQGAAKSVHYSSKCVSLDHVGKMLIKKDYFRSGLQEFSN